MGADFTVFGSGTVLTSSNSTSPIFYPLTQWLDAGQVAKVRASLEMRGNTSLCQIDAAYQCSNDKATMATFQSIHSSWMTADGFQYNTAFADIQTTANGTDQNLYIRFGVQTQKASGSVAGCFAALRVDVVGK